MAACGSARATAGSVSDFIAAHAPASQPGKPPEGSQRSSIANSSTSSIANQKFGTAMPICVKPMIAVSPRTAAAARGDQARRKRDQHRERERVEGERERDRHPLGDHL